MASTRLERDQAALEAYSDGIAQFSSAELERYFARLKHRLVVSRKEVNDPVWGTIQLNPPELIVIDSPLLQRLRRIKQLGVVDQVYPGATHTRLSHSFGVLHQTESLVQAIRLALEAAEAGITIDAELHQLLRLSALCHDIGHGLMSHVSENALEGEPDVNRLERAFARQWKVENPRLSEMAAFFMIRSPAFRKLLERAWERSGLPMPTNDPADFLSCALIGAPVWKDIPLLHEVISGPFDADKLDYLRRDALFAGIPRTVDIPRLIRKLRVAVVAWDGLLPEIARNVEERVRPYAVSGIAQSGARTLDELALARALQHDKVYRHQKVRAAEAMIASVLSLIGESLGPPAFLPLRFVDEAFIDVDADMLRTLSEGKIDETKARTAEDILQRYRDRELFVRGFAWDHAPRPVGLATESHQTQALHRLHLALRRPGDRALLATEIAELAREVARRSDTSSVLDGLVDERLKNYIWIDPPTPPKGRSLLSRALLVSRTGDVGRFRDDYPDTEGWSDQYLVNRDVGYVYCPRQIAAHVFLAAEAVFRKRFSVRVDYGRRSVLEGIELGSVVQLKEKLAATNFYDEGPTDLSPMPAMLRSAHAGQCVDAFLLAAREFMVPQVNEAVEAPLSGPAVRDYLRQFRNDELIGQAMTMVNGVRFFRRDDFAASLRAFVEMHPEFQGAYLCPLGSAKDSSAVVTYLSNDIAPGLGLTVASVHELPNTAERVVFIDDFIGSGRQAVSIIEAWLRMPPSENLGEDRDLSELPANASRAITEAELAFVFCAGLDEGRDRLDRWLREANLHGSTHLANTEADLPSLKGLRATGALSEEFVHHCSAVGEELLRGKGYRPEIVDNRRLGYGNKGLLVAFPYNVPAHTATLLWEDGSAHGREWLPLLPRRRKR